VSPSCARLQVTPAAAAPGSVVRLTGFAPLVSILGSDEPEIFQFEVLPSAQTQDLPQLSSLSVIANELWWLTGTYNGPPTAHNVALSTVSC